MMPKDPQLNQDDFDDCFADEPESVSPEADLARGQHRLRRRRRIIGGTVGGLVAAVVIVVPFLTSQATGPVFDPAVPPSAPVSVCTPGTIRTTDAGTDPARRPIVDESIIPSQDGDRSVLVHAVAATGEVLLEIGRDDSSKDGDTELHPGELYLEDPATGKRTLVRGADDLRPKTQTFFATFDQNFVLWIEAPDTTVNSSAWDLYAFDRATEQISKIGGSDTAPDEDLAPHRVSLWNGTAYWYESRNPGPDQATVFNVYGRELRGDGPTRLLVENVQDPVATDGWLYYQAYDVDPEDGYVVNRRSLTDERTEVVHRGTGTDSGYGVAAVGGVSAWVEGQDVVVYRDSTLIARITSPEGHDTFSVTAGNGMIGFTSGQDGDESPYLLDLRSGCQLHRLTEGQGSPSVLLAGTTAAWTAPDPDNPDQSEWHVATIR